MATSSLTWPILLKALRAAGVDELVLICGESGSGAAVMAHLRGRPHLLYASLVPGSERAQRFYGRYFKRLPFENKSGEIPFAVFLG